MPLNKDIARKEIPFLVPDLPSCDEIMPHLKAMDENRWYSNFGPLQHRFEAGLNESFFPDIDRADERVVTCSSGTAAIELTLLALKLPRGARVLVPSFTFPATATAIIRAGYVPVFADVDRSSWLLTPDIALSCLDYVNCDAVIAVSALGMPQHPESWSNFHEKTGVPVIIDAAASLGNQRIGKGITVCFSLHATKAMGVGEGGLVVAPDKVTATEIRHLSNFGFNDGAIARAGGNHKFSEYQAAVGLAQLNRIQLIQRRREKVRLEYRKALEPLGDRICLQEAQAHIVSHSVVPMRSRVFHGAAAIILKNEHLSLASDVMGMLNKQGIGTRKWYGPALHHQTAFSDFVVVSPQGDHRLANTEWLEKGIIGLPFHNFLTQEEIVYICQCLNDNLTAMSEEREQILTK